MSSQLLHSALAAPGALLLAMCMLAKYVTPGIRRTIGKRVYAIAFRQYKGVARLQHRLRHPLLDALTKLTALTVTVEWYLLSIPPLVWMCGQRGLIAGMAICQCMAVSTYMTCVLKDMLSCPRPYMFNHAVAAAGAAADGDDDAAATADRSVADGCPDLDRASPAPAPAPAKNKTAAAAAEPAPELASEPGSRNGAAVVTATAKISTRPTPTQAAAAGDSKPGSAGDSDPGSEAVTLLEEAYRDEVEYGAPSMHTWCALIMPAYATATAQQLGAIDAARAAALTAAAGCWAMWVGLTRLYLGVHTPIDLLLGALGGAGVLGLWRQLGLAQMAAVGAALPADAAATAAAGGAALWPSELAGAGGGAAATTWFGFGWEPRLAALAAVGLLYVTALATYPVPESHTTSLEYAVIFLGAAYGGLVGANPRCSLLLQLLQHRPGPAVASFAVGGGGDGVALGSTVTGAGGAATLAELLSAAAPPALRHPVGVLALGFAFVVVVKLVSKAVLSELLPKLLDGVPLRLRLMWQPPVHPSGCCAARQQQRQQRQQQQQQQRRQEVELRAASGTAVSADAEPDGESLRKPRGVLMKTPTLPYDVDFLRKFLNYGMTVYAVVEFRHVSQLLLQRDTAMWARQ